MQLETPTAKPFGIRAFASPVRCPYCGDRMVAPIVSAFVEGAEIRHHWECEACREFFITAIPLTTH